MATPQVAGLAGVVLQDLVVNLAEASPNPSLVKALLINGAVFLQPSGGCYYSREREQFAIDPGWGRVDAEKSLYGPVGTPAERNLGYENEVSLNALVTGESYSRQISVQHGAPLKITLVWTDYPAAPGAGSPLVVNDLDLEVSGPEGLYLGNVIVGDWSAPGGTPDRYNVVENVYLPNPAAGVYTITVKGFQVVQDQEPDSAGIKQNFSLVWSANLGNCPACIFPPIQDSAVTSVTAPSAGAIGTQASIVVDIRNEGDQEETVSVSLVDNVGGVVADNNQSVTLAALGNATLSFLWTPTEAGPHTLTAHIAALPSELDLNDNRGSSESVSVLGTTPPPGPGPELIGDDFSGTLANWTVVDEGTQDAPSNWFIQDGVLRQTSNIFDGTQEGVELPKPGTYLLAGDGSWTDYTLSVWLSTTDNDAMGVMFRRQDSDNYYRFAMDSQRGYRRLVKKVGGVFSSVVADTFSYEVGRWYHVQVGVSGDQILIYVDGLLWNSIIDSDLVFGGIALYSWGNNGLSFDAVSVVQGVDTNEPPVVTISSPADGSSATAGDLVAFAGTAVDPEDGDLTANLEWSSNIDGVLGTGGSVLVPLSSGIHTITASALDLGGLTGNAQITITVQVIGGEVVLFSDDFSGSIAAWTIVDEGTKQAPSNWFIDTGVLRQTSNIYGGSTVASGLPKPGTFLSAGDPAWTDYTFTVRMSSTDNDAIGMMFRHQDSNNYYRFSMDSQRGYRRLVKNVGGAFTLLAADNFSYQLGRWYVVEVVLSGGTMQVYIDGALWNTVNDPSLSTGGVALYSWGSDGLSFDDVRVTQGVVFN